MSAGSRDTAAGPAGRQKAVIGRYAGPAGEMLVAVRLLNFPLQVFRAARDRHDEVMREFALLAIRPSGGDRPVPERLLELVEVLGRRYGAASNRDHGPRDAAVARGQLTMNLTYEVPVSMAQPMRELHTLMVAADELCRSEQLLVLAPTETDSRFRAWFCRQFIDQTAGADPVPWDGPLTL